ncbi:hypothetical protein [Bartonella sp. CB189]|uniref:hypothetical protein n=1 Tax=Bartonella sp. CB189 TaxID=3112254 RepID=UPI002F96431D
MSSLFYVLLLVLCTDDFSRCYSHNRMVKTYSTAQACEQALIPSIQQFMPFGEQIFAQCTSVHRNLDQPEIELTWFITNQGNLLLKGHTTDDTMNIDHRTDIFNASLPRLDKLSP